MKIPCKAAKRHGNEVYSLVYHGVGDTQKQYITHGVRRQIELCIALKAAVTAVCTLDNNHIHHLNSVDDCQFESYIERRVEHERK